MWCGTQLNWKLIWTSAVISIGQKLPLARKELIIWDNSWDFYLHHESRSSNWLDHSVRPATLLGCLVCVICNSKSFLSFLFKLCIIIVHILKICTCYFVHISWMFALFWGVLNLDVFLSKMLSWSLVCVFCNSSSCQSFILKLYIMIV